MIEQLHEGAKGEAVVWNLYNGLKGVRSVVDVRLDKRFQDEDVDFLIEDYNRQFWKVEVKTDSMAGRTGNIAYELESSKTYHTPGCFEKTKADYIAYYIPQNEVVHIINVGLLRDYVKNTNHKLVEMGDNAIGYLLKIEELAKLNIIEKTYKI